MRWAISLYRRIRAALDPAGGDPVTVRRPQKTLGHKLPINGGTAYTAVNDLR
jgi:hypothetical protein